VDVVVDVVVVDDDVFVDVDVEPVELLVPEDSFDAPLSELPDDDSLDVESLLVDALDSELAAAFFPVPPRLSVL
jgi:hypothetical protein